MPLQKQNIYRNEWKYLISPWEADHLQKRLSAFMQLDPNVQDGSYMIRSLYFDDYWDSAYNEKLMGVESRQKWRVRIYNCSDRSIRLERKLKEGNYICKEAAVLTRQGFEQILNGDYGFLLRDPQQLCREFYVDLMTKVLRPKVIVDYDRVPYVYDAGTVRITFDYDVRAAIGSFDIFDADLPALSALEENQLVLEVKYTELLPAMIKEILPLNGQEFTAVSKYTLCYERARHLTDPLADSVIDKRRK